MLLHNICPGFRAHLPNSKALTLTPFSCENILLLIYESLFFCDTFLEGGIGWNNPANSSPAINVLLFIIVETRPTSVPLGFFLYLFWLLTQLVVTDGSSHWARFCWRYLLVEGELLFFTVPKCLLGVRDCCKVNQRKWLSTTAEGLWLATICWVSFGRTFF